MTGERTNTSTHTDYPSCIQDELHDILVVIEILRGLATAEASGHRISGAALGMLSDRLEVVHSQISELCDEACREDEDEAETSEPDPTPEHGVDCYRPPAEEPATPLTGWRKELCLDAASDVRGMAKILEAISIAQQESDFKPDQPSLGFLSDRLSTIGADLDSLMIGKE
jgi:hypothetical protein